MKTEITFNPCTNFTDSVNNMRYLAADDILRYRNENDSRIKSLLSSNGQIPKTILRYDYIEDIVKALNIDLIDSYIWVFEELSADTLTYDEPNILFKLFTLKALQSIF